MEMPKSEEEMQKMTADLWNTASKVVHSSAINRLKVYCLAKGIDETSKIVHSLAFNAQRTGRLQSEEDVIKMLENSAKTNIKVKIGGNQRKGIWSDDEDDFLC